MRSLISHAEIGDSILCKDGKILADWLFEYAGSGAADAKEALKIQSQTTKKRSRNGSEKSGMYRKVLFCIIISTVSVYGMWNIVNCDVKV